MPAYSTAVIALVAILLVLGLSRIRLPRKPGFEGIEDPEAARAYDRISRWPQFRMIRRMFAGKLSGYGPAGTLADIGCGPGYLVNLIAGRFPHLHVIGFDSSAEMIRTASLNAAQAGLTGRVEFREGDVSSLPLKEGTLDFVVSTMSLHHWSDPGRGLVEFQRVLKPGGQLLVLDLRRDSLRFIYLLLRFAMLVVVPAPLRRVNEPLGSLLSSYTVAEVEDLLARSTFDEWKVDRGPAWVFAWARKRS